MFEIKASDVSQTTKGNSTGLLACPWEEKVNVPEKVEVGVCHRGQGLHYCLGCAREPCQDDPSNQNSVVEIPAQSKESILICSAISILAGTSWSFNAMSWPCLNCERIFCLWLQFARV